MVVSELDVKEGGRDRITQGLTAHGESAAFCPEDNEAPSSQGETTWFLELRQFQVRSGVASLLVFFLRW